MSVLVWTTVDQLHQANETNKRLAGQMAEQKLSYDRQIEDLQAQIQDLKERWFGSPALWQTPAVAGTELRYFDVQGATQGELIISLNQSNLCKLYTCLPDPGNPGAVGAWGLQGAGTAPGVYCYSPSTAAFVFSHYIVLPRWSPATDGSVKIPLVQKWNALMAAIFTHESKHVSIAQAYEAGLNAQAQRLSSCSAWGAFWQNPHIWDQLDADQNAYHAQLRADCRPEIGCVGAGWLGW